MSSVRWTRSLIVRLALVTGLGGVALTAGLGWVEYRHARYVEATDAAQRFIVVTQQLRTALQPAVDGNGRPAAAATLQAFATHPTVTAARLEAPGWPPLTSGQWPEQNVPHAEPRPHGPLDRATEAFRRTEPTLLRYPLDPLQGGNFDHDGETERKATDLPDAATLSVLTDGRSVRRLAINRALRNAAGSWIVLGLVMLIGLLLMRAWLVRPLERLIGLAGGDADAERFVIAAARTGGELGVLAGAIGGMLRRLDRTDRQLRRREAQLNHLYEHAPMAVISVDREGRVTAANDRAIELFETMDRASLIGRDLINDLHPADRERYRQCTVELSAAGDARLTLRLAVGGRVRELETHAMAVEHANGPLEIRLSFLDVTEARSIVRQTEQQRLLLDLVIDQMPDCVLLVNPDGRIISANAPTERLLGIDRSQLVGERHDPAALWTPLEPLDAAAFERRCEAAASRPDECFEGRFECAVGTHDVLVTPVRRDGGDLLAQLWVVRDVSQATQNRRLLDQREAQLSAIRHIGRDLHEATDVADLLKRSVAALRVVIGVEAAGVALRGRRGEARCRLLIDDGQPGLALPAGRALRDATVEALMPRALATTGSSFWPDLPSAGRWAEPLTRTGMETLALIPLKAGGQTQGVAWIARRGGERIEPHQLHVLEAVGPILSTAVLNAELREDLRDLAMTDPLTDLPSFGRFEWLARRLAVRREAWALLMIDIDRFRRLNDRLGTSAGNAVLSAVATMLRECCRSTDQPVRHSGDRFLIVCPRTGMDEARTLADRLHRVLCETPVQLDDQSVSITCSIGLAGGSGPQTANSLLESAEARLRIAQARGRGRVVADDHPTEAAG